MVNAMELRPMTTRAANSMGSMPIPGQPATEFSAGGVAAAVRGAQSGALKYPGFCRQALEAGSGGNIVSMVWRGVVHYARTGDSHVEGFPAGK
jgi:hypothetical protein